MTAERLESFAKQATCSFLQNFSKGAVGSAFFFPGADFRLRAGALAAGALSQIAYQAACPPSEAKENDKLDGIRGCSKVTNGSAQLMIQRTDGDWDEYIADQGEESEGEHVEILERFWDDHSKEEYLWGVKTRLRDGTISTWSSNSKDRGPDWSSKFVLWLQPWGDAVCGDGSGIPEPPGMDTPFTVTDPESGCSMQVTFQGFLAAGEDAPPSPVWLMQSPPEERSSGGIIGGCNFMPTLYWQPPGGPPTSPPVPPDEDGQDDPDGTPWWGKILIGATGALAGNLLGQIIKNHYEKVYPPGAFDLVAPCDFEEDGKTPLVRTWDFPASKINERILIHQAALMEIMQQHLDWKTPVCLAKYEKGAYVRSLAFESEADPDNNYQRTTKRFRYRSNSPCDVRLLAEHWRDFIWNTGPVIVKHTGSPLGSPQVWAATADEGKRVIQHAGREAGIDPDKAGKWTIGSVDSPRYGLRSTVGLKEVDGIWAATSRIGPSDWPPSSKVP